MKLFDDVRIKKTDQCGTIVDEGIAANGKHFFIVLLDNAAEIDDKADPFADQPCCWDEELELV